MVMERPDILVTDASVLINFLAVDRLDLIAAHPSRCLVTDHVASEIAEHYPDQQLRYAAGLASGAIHQIAVSASDEIELFSQLTATRRLGTGECSAIALAICRQYRIAIDDKQACKQALALRPDLQIISTQDLVVEIVRAGRLDVASADALKMRWQSEFSFALKIRSFADVL